MPPPLELPLPEPLPLELPLPEPLPLELPLPEPLPLELPLPELLPLELPLPEPLPLELPLPELLPLELPLPELLPLELPLPPSEALPLLLVASSAPPSSEIEKLPVPSKLSPHATADIAQATATDRPRKTPMLHGIVRGKRPMRSRACVPGVLFVADECPMAEESEPHVSSGSTCHPDARTTAPSRPPQDRDGRDQEFGGSISRWVRSRAASAPHGRSHRVRAHLRARRRVGVELQPTRGHAHRSLRCGRLWFVHGASRDGEAEANGGVVVVDRGVLRLGGLLRNLMGHVLAQFLDGDDLVVVRVRLVGGQRADNRRGEHAIVELVGLVGVFGSPRRREDDRTRAAQEVIVASPRSSRIAGRRSSARSRIRPMA